MLGLGILMKFVVNNFQLKLQLLVSLPINNKDTFMYMHMPKHCSGFGRALLIYGLFVQTYLQFEEIQACHSHTLLILGWWPV
jgi:hypothetical protein